MNDRLSFGGFILRAVFALALVLLTFNPSGYSYVHMLADGFPHITPIEAVCGLLLLIGWIVFLGATLKSIGLLGMVLATALCIQLLDDPGHVVAVIIGAWVCGIALMGCSGCVSGAPGVRCWLPAKYCQ